MKCILVLALAACAHAAVTEPDYFGAFVNGENGVKTLEPHLSGKPDKEYMALKSAITGAAASHGPVNPTVLLRLAESGRQMPVLVQRLSKKAMEFASGKTAKLRELVKKLCGLSGRRSDAKFNEYVDAAVKKDPELQKQVPLFLALGDLSFR